MGVNIFYRNDGDADMRDEHVFGLIARTAPKQGNPEDERPVEDALWDKFLRGPRKPTQIQTLPAHSMPVLVTLYGEALDQGQIRALHSGQFDIWFMGQIVYEDSVQEPPMDFCVHYQGDPKVVFSCSTHNGEEKSQN